MGKVIRMSRFSSLDNLVIPKELRPKIRFRAGLWRVIKSKSNAPEVIQANDEALLFVVYKNQFAEGGCFGIEKEKNQEAP